MTSIGELKEIIKKGMLDEKFMSVYLDEFLVEYNRRRYMDALDMFQKLFPEDTCVEIYSAPGRSEVCGNHTDHQKGKVLAASVNLDAIAVVSKSDEHRIELVSEGFPKVCVDLSDAALKKEEEGTTAALVRGVAAGMQQRGYLAGGFHVYVTSDVLSGAGMSSSAAFESLIGVILSGLYNDLEISPIEIAQIGQYAENVYFGKPCGLMDQMACSVGGMIAIDFKVPEAPVVESLPVDFEKAGISLCIVDTKGSHADLTDDYAAIPDEMKQIAKAMGNECLRETDEAMFYRQIPRLRKEVSGRAVLRAIHFFEEEKRVSDAVHAIKAGKYDSFMEVIKKSGESSAKYLQNIFSSKDIDTQDVNVSLAVTEHLIGANGVCRVHGGGFAGTIQVFIKNEFAQDYKEEIEKLLGSDSCHVLKVRRYGGIRII